MSLEENYFLVNGTIYQTKTGTTIHSSYSQSDSNDLDMEVLNLMNFLRRMKGGEYNKLSIKLLSRLTTEELLDTAFKSIKKDFTSSDRSAATLFQIVRSIVVDN